MNGGTYDSDNDVCDLTFEGFRNDTHLQEPIHNWIDQSGAEDAEDAEMYCSNWVGGSYDADDDICLGLSVVYSLRSIICLLVLGYHKRIFPSVFNAVGPV